MGQRDVECKRFPFEPCRHQLPTEHAQADAACAHAGAQVQAGQPVGVDGPYGRQAVGQGAAQSRPGPYTVGRKGGAHGLAQCRKQSGQPRMVGQMVFVTQDGLGAGSLESRAQIPGWAAAPLGWQRYPGDEAAMAIDRDIRQLPSEP